nr:hypothetical protein GTC16762_06030 [Pigmentibacter ruber]
MKNLNIISKLLATNCIFIICNFSYSQTFEDENSQSSFSQSDKLIVPNRVYRASPTEADFIFLVGFERQMCAREFNSRERCLDLTKHLLLNINQPNLSVTETTTSQVQNPSAFISTFSDRNYTLENARRSALLDIFNAESPWQRNYFYIYEIIPSNNFVSVTDTYQRELNSAFHDPVRFRQLDNLYSLYANTNEYAAIGNISTRNIVSATRYEFNLETMDFVEGITLQNPHYDSSLQPSIHTNNYPIGDFSNAYQTTNEMFCEIDIRTLQINSAQRDKRSIDRIYSCRKPKFIDEKTIESPEKIFKKSKIKIKTKDPSNIARCLVHDGNFIFVDNCENSIYNEFICTEFGQIISKFNSAENSQFLCLSRSIRENDYLKMEICDLNKTEQLWELKKFTDSNSALYTYKGTGVGFYNHLGTSYLIEKNNNDGYPIFTISNSSEIEEKISKPILQFSIQANIKGISKKNNYTFYPSIYSSVKADLVSELKAYQNYYNANLNLLFSNYGEQKTSSLVCYYSYVGKYGSYTLNLNKISNSYCSNIEIKDDHFKWYFNKNKENNLYEIIDKRNNKLVFSVDFINYHAYVANEKFLLNKNYFQNFSLSKPAKIYAENYAKAKSIGNKQKIYDNDFFNKFAFFSLYDYFSHLYSRK